jgi:hypothetical protein
MPNTIFIDFNHNSNYDGIIRTIHNNENIINIVFQFFASLLIKEEISQKISKFFDNLPNHIENINIIINNDNNIYNIYNSNKLNKVYLYNLPITVKKVFISLKLVKVKKIPFDCKIIYLDVDKPNQEYNEFIITIKPIN